MIRKLFSTPKIGMTIGDSIILFLIGIFLLLLLSCASSYTIQNPIEKAKTDSMIEKATKSYGEPGYEFEYIKKQMVEYYVWWLDDDFMEMAIVVNGKLENVIRFNVPERRCIQKEIREEVVE